jgi:hypothetical protein
MRNALIFALSLILFAGYSQGKLEFESIRHDFGEVEEVGGPVEYTFNFVNTGDAAIKINGVKASCGCTTSGWTKEEIMPGESGFVKAKYNPRNRPGKFSKTLKITSSQASENKTLFISGFVKPKPKNAEEEFPVVLGDLRVKYRSMNLGKITTEKSVETLFDIYNSSDTVFQLDPNKMTVPKHMTVSLVPGFLNPKESGKLKIVYDPIAKNDYGYVSDAIALGTNEEAGLSIITIIEEYFPEMTADELDNAPKLSIADRTHDFGVVKAGEIVEVEVTLENAGLEKLSFRAIKSNCGCITYEVKSKNLKKGRSQTLKLFFDTTELRGNQYKTVTLFSNDPVNPTQIVTIKGKVMVED